MYLMAGDKERMGNGKSEREREKKRGGEEEEEENWERGRQNRKGRAKEGVKAGLLNLFKGNCINDTSLL